MDSCFRPLIRLPVCRSASPTMPSPSLLQDNRDLQQRLAQGTAATGGPPKLAEEAATVSPVRSGQQAVLAGTIRVVITAAGGFVTDGHHPHRACHLLALGIGWGNPVRWSWSVLSRRVLGPPSPLGQLPGDIWDPVPGGRYVPAQLAV